MKPTYRAEALTFNGLDTSGRLQALEAWLNAWDREGYMKVELHRVGLPGGVRYEGVFMLDPTIEATPREDPKLSERVIWMGAKYRIVQRGGPFEPMIVLCRIPNGGLPTWVYADLRNPDGRRELAIEMLTKEGSK